MDIGKIREFKERCENEFIEFTLYIGKAFKFPVTVEQMEEIIEKWDEHYEKQILG